MINIQSNFRSVAKSVRQYMTDCGRRVIEQNRRFFAKATADISAYSVEELKKVHGIIDRQQKMAWRFSPLVSAPPAVTPQKIN